EDELAPENVRPDNLVDPLPFLNAGLWEKVHVTSLVPKEKAELPEEPKMPAGGMGGRGGMMRGMVGGRGGMGMRQGEMMKMQQMQGQMQGQVQNQMKGMMQGMMGRGMMGGMGGMGGMGVGASESVGNFWKSEEKGLMIRALDFTAEPN